MKYIVVEYDYRIRHRVEMPYDPTMTPMQIAEALDDLARIGRTNQAGELIGAETRTYIYEKLTDGLFTEPKRIDL